MRCGGTDVTPTHLLTRPPHRDMSSPKHPRQRPTTLHPWDIARKQLSYHPPGCPPIAPTTIPIKYPSYLRWSQNVSEPHTKLIMLKENILPPSLSMVHRYSTTDLGILLIFYLKCSPNITPQLLALSTLFGNAEARSAKKSTETSSSLSAKTLSTVQTTLPCLNYLPLAGTQYILHQIDDLLARKGINARNSIHSSPS